MPTPEATSSAPGRAVSIPPLGLDGTLSVPDSARGLVLFAHGSGSSRSSPRNTRVAAALWEAGLATLLFDLLSADEGMERAKVFDIALLAERLVHATQWSRHEPDIERLPLGYFGASTGAAAALAAAAQRQDVSAVVSRGGRPDLAMPVLDRVTAPTLLIVGGHDRVVLDLNRAALAELGCEKRLEVVPGASHLFEEPGTLAAVIVLAREWFRRHFDAARQSSAR